MEREALALLLQQGVSVEKIAAQVGKHPSTVAYWMKKFGLEAPNREKHAARGGIPRERLEELVEGGLTVRQIAEAVGLSGSTVRHWLRRYGLKTHNKFGPRFDASVTVARQSGVAVQNLVCFVHGETEYVLEGRGYYRCKRCRNDRISRHRRRLREALVAEAGGACALCGYDQYVGALQFHHVDPATKRVQISGAGLAVPVAELRQEVEKCVLLCANCHAEVESGMRTLGVE